MDALPGSGFPAKQTSSRLTLGTAIKRAVYAHRAAPPPVSAAATSLAESAAARYDVILSRLQRLHARDRSDAAARAALLLWHQWAVASRSAASSAAAAADSAAAKRDAEMQLQRVAVQLAASADAQRKRLLDSITTSFRCMVAGACESSARAAPLAQHSDGAAAMSSVRSRSHSLGSGSSVLVFHVRRAAAAHRRC
jgi:hypothetical protein